eukprot:9912807-Alexandrium_andersonii.AAC.1
MGRHSRDARRGAGSVRGADGEDPAALEDGRSGRRRLLNPAPVLSRRPRRRADRVLRQGGAGRD